MENLVNNFSQYFVPRYAASRHHKRFSYSIRYKVYVEELGWEPLNSSRLETDHYDSYAHPCLLEHKRTRDFAGCVRLVVPQSSKLYTSLPYQQHHIEKVDSTYLRRYSPTEIGEISRLAVPGHFRRRANEKGKPFILESCNSSTFFNEDERKNFPYIAVGLYLSAIAMVELCGLKLVLVVMEPRLQRHLRRYGIYFQQISDTFEFKGQRALFELPRRKITQHMKSHVRDLYELILMTLVGQSWQHPQTDLQVQLPNDSV
jgi:N-acyl amino acid synthase of PEP-CTERM/exosortase system